MVKLNPKKFIKTLTAKKTNTEKLAEKMSKYWQNNSDIPYVKELDDNFFRIFYEMKILPS